MHPLNRLTCICVVIVSTSILSFSLCADPVKSPVSTDKNTSQASGTSDSALKASANASLAWLGLIDKNQYGESWDQSSSITKLTVKRDEWIQIMDKTRKPFGSVSSREVLDQRTAKDPSGLPKGDYIVMFYKTAFSHKPSGHELVTLFLEDGQWKVLTYQVDGQ